MEKTKMYAVSLGRVLSLLLALCLFVSGLCLPPLSATEATASVTGVSMSITSDLGIHFYITAPTDAEKVGAYVNGHRLLGQLQEDGRYKVSYCRLAAHQLVDKLNVVPFSVKDHSEKLGADHQTTAASYLTRLAESEDISPEMRKLVVATLNYGAAAQAQFNYKVSTLANSGLAAVDRVVPTRTYENSLKLSPDSGSTSEAGAVISGATLLLENRIRFQIMINVDGQEDLRCNNGAPANEIVNGMTPAKEAAALVKDMYLEVSPDADFADAKRFPLVKFSSTDKKGYYAVTDGLYPDEIARDFYFRVVTPDGYRHVLVYSGETYTARYAAQMSEVPLVLKAMMALADAAVAYRAAS